MGIRGILKCWWKRLLYASQLPFLYLLLASRTKTWCHIRSEIQWCCFFLMMETYSGKACSYALMYVSDCKLIWSTQCCYTVGSSVINRNSSISRIFITKLLLLNMSVTSVSLTQMLNPDASSINHKAIFFPNWIYLIPVSFLCKIYPEAYHIQTPFTWSKVPCSITRSSTPTFGSLFSG